MRFLAILAAALAFTAAAAPAQAELGDSLYSLTERTTVHERPGADEPVVMQVERSQELVENQRLGPGTHELFHTCSWSDDCETYTIAEGAGEWVHVTFFVPRAKSGWVRAADVELDYVREVVANVIDPCLLKAIKLYGLHWELGEETALRFLKTEMLDVVRAQVQEIVPLVEGRPREARLSIYESSLAFCIAESI